MFKYVQIPNNPIAPFVREITDKQILNRLGYILGKQSGTSSVIIIKKGGHISMIKTIVEALEGFQKQFDELNEMKANIEVDKKQAIAEATAEVEKKFAEKLDRIDKVLELVSVSKEIEVEDEENAEEDAETQENADGTVNY